MNTLITNGDDKKLDVNKPMPTADFHVIKKKPLQLLKQNSIIFVTIIIFIIFISIVVSVLKSVYGKKEDNNGKVVNTTAEYSSHCIKYSNSGDNK
jgi:hypothetical protein